jgi:hypothetical protein
MDLVQTHYFGRGSGIVEIGIWVATPQSQRSISLVEPLSIVPCFTCPPVMCLEAHDIDRTLRDLDQIPGTLSHDLAVGG